MNEPQFLFRFFNELWIVNSLVDCMISTKYRTYNTKTKISWRVNKLHTQLCKENTIGLFSTPYYATSTERFWFCASKCSNSGCGTNTNRAGPQFNMKISSHLYKNNHCRDKTVERSSYLHNGIFDTGKTTSLYWIRAQITRSRKSVREDNNDEIKWHSVVFSASPDKQLNCLGGIYDISYRRYRIT